MIRTRLGLLGLCAVVFGVMAFGASAAQAETGASWLILTAKGELKKAGDVIGGLELLPTVIGNIENAHAALLVPNVLGFHVLILCTAGTLTGIKLEKNGTVTKGGKVTFTGCKVLLNEVLNTACEPHSVGSPVGTVATNEGKGLLVLIGGKVRTRIESKNGGEEPLANINMGEECPIGENIPVRGKLYLKDEAVGTHLVKHLIEEDTVNSDVWVLNKEANHKATIKGTAEVYLSGAHEGLKWSGDPA